MRPSVLAAAALAASSLSDGAHATVYSWNFTPGMPGSYAYSPGGGSIDRIDAVFDSAAKHLTWNVQFGPSSAGSPLETKGFWLVVNNGPNPKAHPGELAIIYFDASTVGQAGATPKMSVYGYNGANAANSFNDGNGDAPGTPPGDLIKGVNDTSYILDASAADVNVPGTGLRRVMSFTIDASSIIAHAPLYPDATDPWYGTGFDTSLGVWFHPVKTFSASYGASGGINSLLLGAQGYLDGEYFRTVPTPGAVALLGVGGMVATRRRRR
jgi:hypothetical protein